MYGTVRLTTYAGQAVNGFGTGFYWTTDIPDVGQVHTIVTNQHVVRNADTVRFDMQTSQDTGGGEIEVSGSFINAELDLEGKTGISHPNPDIDLCALTIGELVNQARERSTPPFFISADISIVPSDDSFADFDSIEEVTMVGCPRGIYDSYNRTPIARRGITATPLRNSYEGREEFLVDMACYPGSSGSPIFVTSTDSRFDRKSGTYVLGGRKMALVGVLYSGPLISNEGEIILNSLPTVNVSTMMHLGQAIRSSALRQLDEEIVRQYHSQHT